MPVATTKKSAKKGSKVDAGATTLSGVYMFPNGDKYDGEYIQVGECLQRQGYGTHTTIDGLTYHGNWSGDKMNGQGELLRSSVYFKVLFTSVKTIFVNSLITITGEFGNNMFHGFGKYTWPDGSYYEGNFNENKLEGQGTFTDVKSQVWYGNFTHMAAPGLKFKLCM
ncbi:MORN repeat-containing protein 1-like [Stylophora pistillata]|uniref:MORN repeat-containing protein 1-like n=1 Tax=Stylophora pistillata TaxID=50429 RepID=UPI000C041CDE|nr:MORN repeat-containing protein 1-like [Stylophora pistillata]